MKIFDCFCKIFKKTLITPFNSVLSTFDSFLVFLHIYMEYFKNFIHVFSNYINGTYETTMPILAMEIGLFVISISQANPQIFGELADFFFKWHTVLLGPMSISKAIKPITKKIWPLGHTPNLWVCFISLISISIYSTHPTFSILILFAICFVFFVDRVNSLSQIIVSILFAFIFVFWKIFSFYFTEKTHLMIFDYHQSLYIIILSLTAIHFIPIFKMDMRTTLGYHSILIQNLGFLVFDAIIYFTGKSQGSHVIFALFCNIIVKYISLLMKNYC